MGWFGREPRIPALVEVPKIAELPPARLRSAARYLGTVTVPEGERVRGRSLSARSAARLSLSAEALDVVRMGGSFRIPAESLRGARGPEEFAGRAGRDLLVVRWDHQGHHWETGFRMEAERTLKDGTPAPRVDAWVRTISKMARGNR